MKQAPSVRVVACDVNTRPQLRNIDADKAIYVRTNGGPTPDLSFYCAQFGPVLNVIRTQNPQSNIVLFFSEESARRAKDHRFPGSIRISQYIRQTAKGEWGAAACARIAGEGSPLTGTRTQQLDRSKAPTRTVPKIYTQGKLTDRYPAGKGGMEDFLSTGAAQSPVSIPFS